MKQEEDNGAMVTPKQQFSRACMPHWGMAAGQVLKSLQIKEPLSAAVMAHLHYAWSLPSGEVEDSRKWAGSKWFGRWPRVWEEVIPGRPLPDYQLHLHRLLGPEKASYFLQPSTLDQPVSPRVQCLLAADLDMGAEEVWSALHEEPKRLHEIAEAKKGRLLSQRVPWLGCPSVTLRMQQIANWRQQLHNMHRLGKQHQRSASRLLASKHLTDLSDMDGTEGLTRYLHCSLDKD